MNLSIIVPACTACKHLVRVSPQGGVCRRHAPAAAVVPWTRLPNTENVPPFNQASTVWPPVADADFCGEFEAKVRVS